VTSQTASVEAAGQSFQYLSSCRQAKALVAAWFMAVVQKHWLLHASSQLCRSIGGCMVHGSCAEALVAAWFIVVVQKH